MRTAPRTFCIAGLASLCALLGACAGMDSSGARAEAALEARSGSAY